jgi:hypothetical protein
MHRYSLTPEPLFNNIPLKVITSQNFKTFFGEPSDVESSESGSTDEQLTIYHYDELNISLFFQQETLITISVTHPELLLFDTNVFKLKEKEITELFAANEIKEFEIDKDWGEKQLAFDSAGITFFFDNQKVSEVFIDML